MQQRHFLHGDFNPQVAPRHHHGVGRFQNCIEVFDGLGLFNFGHHTRVLSSLFDLLLKLQDVRRLAHKRQPDPIHVLLERKHQVFGVLWRDARKRNLGLRQVQALPGTERSTMDDVAHHLVFPVGGFDRECQFPVVEQHAFALLHIRCKRSVVRVHHAVFAFAFTHADGECFALHQSHFTASNFTHTKLGPLQIRQNSGVRAQFPIDAAHRVNGRAMHFVGAMGKVDAGHVEALEDQLGQHFLRGRGRAKGGHNFGAFGDGLLLRHKVRVGVGKVVSFRLQKWVEMPILQRFWA